MLALLAAVVAVPGALGSATSRPITGFGATIRAWNSAHKMDTRGNLIRGCCYDPIGSRPGVRYASRSYAVQAIGGRVLSYEEWLGNGTSVRRARAAALRELPTDARVQSFTVHDHSCAILIATSRTLGAALRSGAAGGEVVVEFSSGADESGYNRSSVNNLLFTSAIIAGPTAQNC